MTSKINGIVCAFAFALSSAPAAGAQDVTTRVERLLARTPVIDGHNDLAWELRERFNSDLSKIDLRADTSKLPRAANARAVQVPLMTDIARLRAGHVGGQFWSVWIPTSVTGAAAVKMTMEQIDLVKRIAQRYPADFAMAYSADDVERVYKAGRIASLIGIEGGHQIDNSLPALRQLHALGARYMTLSHSSNNSWADAATDNPVHKGLSPFGLQVVREMNRVGMLVDLSHVSPAAMKAALAETRAPVMFSHSNARALVEHPRNVPDDVLALLAKNGGVAMVNFYPGYVSQVAGVDHVGIGTDLDGIPGTPVGLEGVDKYPRLFEDLARRGWSDAELAKLSSGNILRVLRAGETVANRLQASEAPSVATIEP